MVGERPVVETVRKMAISSAFHDPRFKPLSLKELDDISVEISLLSQMRQISDINSIVVGTHGVLVKRGMRSGVLLPQVAISEEWDRYQFISYTCRKAGLPADAWRDANIAIYVFSAVLFSEKDIGQHTR